MTFRGPLGRGELSLHYQPIVDLIVRAVVALAHELSMFVIAEGVEQESEVEFLRAIGCDAIQGFFLASAVSAEDLFRAVGRRSAPRR